MWFYFDSHALRMVGQSRFCSICVQQQIVIGYCFCCPFVLPNGKKDGGCFMLPLSCVPLILVRFWFESCNLLDLESFNAFLWQPSYSLRILLQFQLSFSLYLSIYIQLSIKITLISQGSCKFNQMLLDHPSSMTTKWMWLQRNKHKKRFHHYC